LHAGAPTRTASAAVREELLLPLERFGGRFVMRRRLLRAAPCASGYSPA